MEFKDRLQALRTEKGISATQLAAAFGKTDAAIRMWETGRSKPDADTIVALSQYFGCTVDYLLGQSNTRNQASFDTTNQALIEFECLVAESLDSETLLRSLVVILRTPLLLDNNKDILIKSVRFLLAVMAHLSIETSRILESETETNANQFSTYYRLLDADLSGMVSVLSLYSSVLMEETFLKASLTEKDTETEIIRNIWLSFLDRVDLDRAKAGLIELQNATQANQDEA